MAPDVHGARSIARCQALKLGHYSTVDRHASNPSRDRRCSPALSHDPFHRVHGEVCLVEGPIQLVSGNVNVDRAGTPSVRMA
jgi:hypothetical protein